jgi:phosphatidylserine/phosphatidylglycerophosphate/cardiolipin synthase-like enzyme
VVQIARIACLLVVLASTWIPAQAYAKTPATRDLYRLVRRMGLSNKHVRLALRRYRFSLPGARPGAYRQVLRSIEHNDKQLAAALTKSGLGSHKLQRSTDLGTHFNQLRALTAGERVTDRLGLKYVLQPHYRAKNKRWGFLSRGGKVRRGLKRARQRLDTLMDRFKSTGLLDADGARRVKSALLQRLDQVEQQTHWKRFPDQVEPEPGSKGWWRRMGEFAQVASRPYSKLDLLVDGPQWRRETRGFVARARGHLHIASWAWNYDRQGRWLADQVIARKLQLSPKVLTERVKGGESLVQIRDGQLAARMAARDHLSPGAAARAVAKLPEKRRRQLVGELLEPLEVRVLLGKLIQTFERIKHPRATVLKDMRRVGVEVIRDYKLFSKRAPFVNLQNLWASTPHAKMLISGDRALTGGLNIGDQYLQPQRKGLVWHDAAVSVTGAVVHDLNRSFISHWNRAVTKRGDRAAPVDPTRSQRGHAFYFPESKRRARGEAMVVGTDALSASDKTTYSHRTALMLGLASARKSFSMVVPYLTSPLVVKQILRTAQRFKAEGKDPSKILIMLTGHTDTPLTGRFITSHFVHQMQQAGVRVLQWRPDPKATPYTRNAMHHAKIWMADDKVAYLGSANATVRSLVQDWEIGLLSQDIGFIRRIKREIFERDLASCKPPPPSSIFTRRVGNAAAMLFGPIMRLL